MELDGFDRLMQRIEGSKSGSRRKHQKLLLMIQKAGKTKTPNLTFET